MNIEMHSAQTPDPANLEETELKIALQSRMPFKGGCEAAVREALAPLGGHLLFQMPSESDETGSWTGVVLFGSDEDGHIGLITISKKGGVSVETAEQSPNPIAKIVPAYLAVMAHLQPAA